MKGALHSDIQETASLLLSQFQAVFSQDGAKKNLPGVKHRTIRRPNTDISNDVSGVSKLLSGLDSIPNIILKFYADSIAPGLSAIFQLSLATGSLLPD